jgi:hypothetical protein
MSIAIFFTLASCALPWIAYYVADWKLFAVITSAPLCLAIFTPFVVPESARLVELDGIFVLLNLKDRKRLETEVRRFQSAFEHLACQASQECG